MRFSGYNSGLDGVSSSFKFRTSFTVSAFYRKQRRGSFVFSAILHLGTLVAVFVAFRKTIWDMIKELGVMIKDIFTGKFTLKI